MANLMQAWVAAMRAGRFDRAWALSEQVLRGRDPTTRDDPALPYHLRWVWDGRPFDQRHVLVRCYHGLGDTLQFARYLPVLAKRAASVTVEIQPQLLPLLSLLEADLRLLPFDPARPLPEAECDLEIMELAFALRTPPGAAPPPYLRVPADVVENRVGLCHVASNWDEERSVPPELLAYICRSYDCLSLVPGNCGLSVRNPHGCTLDIMETASLAASAGLIITVDTMIAHLAGAIGKPTWLLLKAEPDWRWPLGRFSPWYPSMRLYHQPARGDWASVIGAVEADLAAFHGGDSRLRTPAPLIEREEARV